MSKTAVIKQSATIPASPREVYSALMSSAKHSKFTGAPAKIGKKAGDAYYTYDGYITGRNVELKPGKLIVQTWVAMEDKWPEGHVSTVSFELKEVKGGTKINFLHTDVPIAIARNFVTGWKDYYWNPLKKYFRANKH